VSAYALSEAMTCDEAIQCCEDSILSSFRDLRNQGTQTDESPNEGREMVPSTIPWEHKSQLRLNLTEGVTAPEHIHQATQRTANSSDSGQRTTGWNPVNSNSCAG